MARFGGNTMTRKAFMAEYIRFITLAMKLSNKTLQHGLSSLKEEIDDIDDELFKQGLRFIVDGTEPRLIDEIMTNRIAHEKDKQQRILKTVQKRAVLGIQAGEYFRVFYNVLKSLPGLTAKEENKVDDAILFSDD
jgi:flagellar motor component MotA